MGGDDPHDLAGAAHDRNGEQGLEVLLLELRHVLHARVGKSVVADERRLAVLGRPPGESFSTRKRDLADQAFIGR